MTKKLTKPAAILSLAAAAALTNAPAAQAATCTPADVVELTVGGSRISVRCSAPVNISGANVSYVAISTTAPNASRFLQLALTALLSGRKFQFDEFAAPTAGCGADCRTPNRFGIVQ